MGQMKKACFILIIIIMGCVAGSCHETIVEAKAADIQMSISVNFDQKLKEGRKADVWVTVKNEGKAFDGYLELNVDLTSSSKECVYQKKIAVSAQKENTYEMILPTAHISKAVTIRMLDASQNVLASQKRMLDLDEDMGCQYVGTIGEKLACSGQLEKYNLRNIQIALNKFPNESDGLDSLETILIDKKRLPKVEEECFDSLKEWNQNGGTIIIEGISQKMRTYLGYGNQKVYGLKNQKQKESYQVYQNGNGLVVEWQGEDSLYNRILSKDGKDYILKCITSTLSDTKRAQMQREQGEEKNSLESMLRSLKQAEPGSIPKAAINAGILSIYIIMAGPVLYFFLRKRKRRNAYYASAAVLSVCFSIVILAVNKGWRTSLPYVNCITINSYHPLAQTKTENTYFNIMLSSRKDGILSLPKGISLEALSVPESEGHNWLETSRIFRTEVLQGTDDTRIRIEDPSYMKCSFFDSKNQEEMKGSMAYSLKLKNNLLMGNIKNQLGYDLKNVIIVGNYHFINVGTLKSGDVYKISRHQSVFKDTGMKVELDRILSDASTHSALGMGLSEAYEYCLMNECSTYNNDTFLIGTAYSDNQSTLSENGLKSRTISLVVYPFTEVGKKAEQYDFLTDIDKYKIGSNYENEPGDRGRAQRTVEKEYSFPSQIKVKRLVYSQGINKSASSSYEIMVFNHKENRFEAIFDSSGTQTFELTKEYLSERNRLVLKLKSRESGMSMDSFELPVISANVEAQND